MSYRYSLVDKILMGVQGALETCIPQIKPPSRANPADEVKSAPLQKPQLTQTIGAMRVNHAGEIAAQGLYIGQAITARAPLLAAQMQQAAIEEIDHLIWCQQRLAELGSHPSRLALLWYIGALSMGIVAGLAGDRWNLGFLMETEYQVMTHLQGHQQLLPTEDQKSQRIIAQMIEDESKHAQMAKMAGATELPRGIKKLMHSFAKVMTTTAYYV